MGHIVLSQIASWNPKLTNPYRTRWATAGGRYFEVRADFLYTPWFVSEVTAEGEWMPEGFSSIAFTLAEARAQIAEATKE
jgi:hypothetical protein